MSVVEDMMSDISEDGRVVFEDVVYRKYFISNVSADLKLNSKVLSKAEFCKRDPNNPNDYVRRSVSAAWWGWRHGWRTAITYQRNTGTPP